MLGAMPSVTLRAHFDGERIRLDEPFELPQDAALLVTILPPASSDDDRAAWLAASQAGLARAYGDEEPEYGPDDIKR